MALTNRQIERSSRQLIVRDFGAAAQQRLLAARVLLAADFADAGVLPYLVGAGVGHLALHAPLDSAAPLISRLSDLNRDSTVRLAPASGELAGFDLAVILIDNAAALDRARALYDRLAHLTGDFGIVLARLDQPPRLAVIPRRPPCPRCATAGDLLGPVGAPAANAGFVASLAALEAIKLLARFAPAPAPTLIEMRGYASSTRVIASAPGADCACAAILAAATSS